MVKGYVSFNSDYCKGCKLCIEICPKQILAINEDKINSLGYNPAYCINQDECIGCANCALICPDSIIKVERE